MWMIHGGLVALYSKDPYERKESVSDFVTPWTVACQAPSSIGFSWQE